MFSDGSPGNPISLMRVVTLLIILTVLIPKVVIACQTGVPPVFTPADMSIIGIALGAKIVQNTQEKST